jgi:L-ascorbate metabolism protein UlaG (beta-lactamase superfamily)
VSLTSSNNDCHTVLAVAMDQPDAARPWVEAAKPAYPCLIDRDHLLADLYHLVNVPQAVWIDERGRIVALHSNGLDPDYIGGDLGKAMKDSGIAGDVGLATGYVLRFSTGLVVYLSGDTGITADQELVVRNHYNARLAVMNIGDGFTTGPVEAAYVINDLVKPASVIASHANEVATAGGKVRPGTKTETFIKAVKVPVHVPLSGRTMEFDAAGRCTAGC